VIELTESFLNGTIEGGNHVGDVALAPFHDFEDAVNAETRSLLERAELGVRTGAILTCYLLDLSGLRIGLVMDNVVDDATFNESAWNGLLATQGCGAEIASVESQSPEDYATNIAQFAEDGYNVIVTVGFTMEEATLEAAAMYPDIRFIGIDQVQTEPAEGVTGLIFQEDHSGFLAGWLAARMSQSGTIAAVLASEEAPPVVAFNEGFRAGALRANPGIRIISTYHPGDVDASFNDSEWGATTARDALDQGADVIFAAAGNTGNGALLEVAAAAEEGNPPYCIGVDTDQWFTVPEAHPCLVSSAVKIIDGGLTTLIIQTNNGTIEDGNFVGIVGLAPYHDFEFAVPSNAKAELDRLATNLASGLVNTGVSSRE
jgi:basic membrane protein A